MKRRLQLFLIVSLAAAMFLLRGFEVGGALVGCTPGSGTTAAAGAGGTGNTGGGSCGEVKCQANEKCLDCGNKSCQPMGMVCCDQGSGPGGTSPVICSTSAGMECVKCGSAIGCQETGSTCCVEATGAGGNGPVYCGPKEQCSIDMKCAPK